MLQTWVKLAFQNFTALPINHRDIIGFLSCIDGGYYAAVGCLTPSNTLVYLRDRSTQTIIIVRAATLR